MREKMVAMELAMQNCTEEKLQYEEKIEKLKSCISRLEGEKRSLQEELSRTESRATKLELHRMSLEGDLQRVQLMLQVFYLFTMEKKRKIYKGFFFFVKFNEIKFTGQRSSSSKITRKM